MPYVHVILQLTLRGFERVADGDVNIRVRRIVMVRRRHREFAARHLDIQADTEVIALAVAMMFHLQHDMTADNAVAKLLKLVYFFPYHLLYGVRTGKVLKGDLYGLLHELTINAGLAPVLI